MEENVTPSRITWDDWIREIRDIGKTNGLTNFAYNDYGQIDLDRAHPGGIAQFTSTGVSLLSNLVREPLAFSKALTTARRIKAKAVNHLNNFGLHTVYMVGGVASLEQDGFDLTMPILLWPVSLTRKTDDFEIARTGSPFVNPALVSALFHTYGVTIDPAKITSLVNDAADLFPISVTEHISSLLESEARVEFKRVLVVGNFAVEPSFMEADIRPEGNTLLRQLAEVSEVTPLETEHLGEIRLVADADATQRRIVARATRGDSFAVETLPGSGYTQTVVNLLTSLVHDGKKVLVVTPRRQTLNELAERLGSLGLGGLLARNYNLWLDVVGSISRYERAGQVDLVTAGVKRDSSATILQNYLDGLAARNETLGLSLIEILDALSKLAAMPNAPTSIARLDQPTLERFRSRVQGIELLERASQAGLFSGGTEKSAWFAANFENETQVSEITELAKSLNEVQFPALTKKLDELVLRANFKTPSAFGEYGEYLKVLGGVAASLDRFAPEIFERDVTELIEATGPRKFGGNLSGSTRRRLKKLAKEYLRSGMSVSDLHTALKAIKEQREAWRKFALTDSIPTAIIGVSDATVAYRSFISELARVQLHLDSSLSTELLDYPPTQFAKVIGSLAKDTEPLAQLEIRNAIRSELKSAGLDEVYRDFARISVKPEHIAAEFDQVWWQSAFELLLRLNPDIASVSPDGIRLLENDFSEADRQLNELGVQGFNQLQAHHWKERIEANAIEAASLKEVLKTRTASFRSLRNASKSLSDVLLGAFAASPYELASELPADAQFDTVMVLDAAGTNVGDNITALQRAKQVVAFGDSAIASPIGFELEASELPITLEASSESIFDKVARIFGVESMRKSWRPTGQTLGSLINREFYQNRIVFEPTSSEYAGRSNFDLHLVKTSPATASDTLAESPNEEVEAAVHLVVEHAKKHPEESLLIVSASVIHAERIRNALDREVLEHAEVKQFFDAHGDEKFEVSTLNELSHRVADRVIFSPGFGVLASGKAANNLGQLSLGSGRRTLANLLVSARKSLTMVTSITADQLPEEPVGAAKQFAKMYRYATAPQPVDSEIDSDPMLSDLALRLRKLGAHVTIGYTPRIPMAVSYGATSAIILPDWSLIGDDLSEKIRLRPALLAAMGWKTIRVHALEVFADPQALAVRIGDELGMAISRKPQTLFDEPSFDETDLAWGENRDSNDQRLKNDKPPHWG